MRSQAQPSTFHEAKAGVAPPPRVLLTHEVHQKYGAYVRANPGRDTHRWATLIEAGLRTSGFEKVAKELNNQLSDLHRLLSAAVGLDEEPHPRPKGVDPKVWAHREEDRIRKIREHQARALVEAERMVGRAIKALQECSSQPSNRQGGAEVSR